MVAGNEKFSSVLDAAGGFRHSAPEQAQWTLTTGVKSMSVATWFYTKLHGELVGEDSFGNRYYRSKRKRAFGREQRWAVFADGSNEPSNVPAEWHAWLHHTTDEPVRDEGKPWIREHVPNLTGTTAAYLPPGADARGGVRAATSGDYEAWSPES